MTIHPPCGRIAYYYDGMIICPGCGMRFIDGLWEESHQAQSVDNVEYTRQQTRTVGKHIEEESGMETQTVMVRTQEEKRAIGGRIREVRKAKGWLSPKDIASRIGKPVGTVASIESGTGCREEVLDKIIEAIGVDPVWVKTGEGSNPVFPKSPLIVPEEPVPAPTFIDEELKAQAKERWGWEFPAPEEIPHTVGYGPRAVKVKEIYEVLGNGFAALIEMHKGKFLQVITDDWEDAADRMDYDAWLFWGAVASEIKRLVEERG